MSKTKEKITWVTIELNERQRQVTDKEAKKNFRSRKGQCEYWIEQGITTPTPVPQQEALKG